MNFQQFIQEFEKLKLRFPQTASHSLRSENSDYGDYFFACRNMFFSFDDAQCENSIYLFDSFKTKDSVDGDYIVESEKCYECVDLLKCYNSTYLNYCARVYDSHFCWDCGDSNNLFGCVHLKFKQYCIFNKQYTKEEYDKKAKELLQRPVEINLKELNELTKNYPITTTNVTHSENCDYCNHVHDAKNYYLCFDAGHGENCAYLYDAFYNKNCYDFTQSFHSESSYECVDCSKLNKCFFMKDCTDMYDSGFCEHCIYSHDLFGCYGLNKKEYCILNKQYSKEDYQKEVSEIVESYRKEKAS